MKGRYIVILFLCSLFAVSPTWAHISRTWDAGYIVNDITFDQEGTCLIYCKGDITINGTITITGTTTTVRFLNVSGKEITIKNGYTGIRIGREPMFKVLNGAKLAFNYKDDAIDVTDENGNTVRDDINNSPDGSNVLQYYQPITIDGGADFLPMVINEEHESEWTMESQNPNSMFRSAIIQSIGALELFHVTIRNFHGQDEFMDPVNNKKDNSYNQCGIISLVPSTLFEDNDENKYDYRYTRLVNCTFEKSKARVGTVINVGNSNHLKTDDSVNPNDDEHIITLENCTIRNCVAYGDQDNWGGIIRFRGGSMHSLKLKNCLFTNNFSHGDGAGLWWNAAGHKDTQCIIDGCTFTKNRAMRECGALRLETTFQFSGGVTTVSENECFGLNRITDNPNTYESCDIANGGGISIYGYASKGYTVGGTFNYNLTDRLIVKKNYAKGHGGGIVFDFTTKTQLSDGTTINAYFDGAVISDNESNGNGGGVCFRNETDPTKNYTFYIYLNKGNINGNKALEGGGIYVDELDIQSTVDEIINITGNTATNGSGGGIYLKDGEIKLNKVNVINNRSEVKDVTSFYGGGGLYVENGSFTIESGEISGNKSTSFGGGVLVRSTSAETQTVTLSGGTIKENEAHYGGGLAGLGNLSLLLNNVDIENNTAKNGNGGGIFARGGITSEKNDKATLIYTKGLVKQNKATCAGEKPETAYGNNAIANITYAEVAGMGGGICLGMNTTLNFATPTDFGIYDNEADSGADDLFTTENNTTVNLPNVGSMKLTGYGENQQHKLFWFEDYITHDPNYCFGTAINKEWTQGKSLNERYRDVRNRIVDGNSYYVDFEEATSMEITNKYLCLTLGWNVGLITLIKNGMADGDNAIFRILKKQKDENYKEYMTVILTDADNKNGKRSKQITLNEDGIWKIVETPWSWAYTSDNPNGIERTLDASSSIELRTFEFTNTLNTSGVPAHGESVKINEMHTTVQQE